jgi:hypothetical protein
VRLLNSSADQRITTTSPNSTFLRTDSETAKIMIAHGLQLEVQVLDAKEYFEWLGVRQNTYQAQQDYPGGQHVPGDEAKALLGIK